MHRKFHHFQTLLLLLSGFLLGAVPTALASYLFFDVSEDAWYYDAILSLRQKGLVEGYSDGTYKPEACVNRAEMAATLDRVILYLEEN